TRASLTADSAWPSPRGRSTVPWGRGPPRRAGRRDPPGSTGPGPRGRAEGGRRDPGRRLGGGTGMGSQRTGPIRVFRQARVTRRPAYPVGQVTLCPARTFLRVGLVAGKGR